MGTVTSPAARSSMDCENAASALLDLATSRAAAWRGKYSAWNMQDQGDVWPGDVLAVTATSTGLNADLVVRAVEIELSCTVPGLAKYVVSFANDWADALAIKTSTTVPADVWLPQQPENHASAGKSREPVGDRCERQRDPAERERDAPSKRRL